MYIIHYVRMLVQRFEPPGRRFTNFRYYYSYYSGGDSVACLPLPPPQCPLSPTFSSSLISLIVSVDVKHHVYLRRHKQKDKYKDLK